MSSLEIITYDIYDEIPIVANNNNEYYFLDFYLKNVRGKKSSKPQKYFDDPEVVNDKVVEYNHDYFIIEDKKKIWNKHSPSFNEPYHFENYMCGEASAQLVNGYELRKFILRIIERFQNVPDLKIYIVDKDNVALEYSNIIPCCSHTRARLLIEYHKNNLLRLLKVVNSEVAKELDEAKPQLAKGFKTCDVDFDEFFKGRFNINTNITSKTPSSCGNGAHAIALSRCTCSYCQCSHTYTTGLILTGHELSIYNNNNNNKLMSLDEFNKHKLTDQIEFNKKYYPFKVLFYDIHEINKSLRNKITYDQNDDEYWDNTLTKSTTKSEEPIKQSSEIESILNVRVAKLVKEHNEEIEKVKKDCEQLVEQMKDQFKEKLNEKNEKINELSDQLTKMKSSKSSSGVDVKEIASLKASNAELDSQNTTLTTLVSKLKKLTADKDQTIDKLQITVSEQSAKLEKQQKIINKLTAL